MSEMTERKFDQVVQLMTLWSGQWQEHILRHGAPLSQDEIRQAQCIGIAAPEKVRVLKVPNIPMPPHPLLYSTLIQSDVFDLDANGLTLEYGIFLKSISFPQQYWLTHELVHVGQYERMGGLLPCLRQYLRECLRDGYLGSSLEREAHRIALECLAQNGIKFDFGNEIEPDRGDLPA